MVLAVFPQHLVLADPRPPAVSPVSWSGSDSSTANKEHLQQSSAFHTLSRRLLRHFGFAMRNSVFRPSRRQWCAQPRKLSPGDKRSGQWNKDFPLRFPEVFLSRWAIVANRGSQITAIVKVAKFTASIDSRHRPVIAESFHCGETEDR